MIQDISRYISILTRLQISPSQFLFMYLTHLQNFKDIIPVVSKKARASPLRS